MIRGNTDAGSVLAEKLRWLSVELLQYLESLLRLYKFGYRAACIAVIANELVSRSGEFNGAVLPLFPTVHAFERDPCFLHTRRSTADLYYLPTARFVSLCDSDEAESLQAESHKMNATVRTRIHRGRITPYATVYPGV